MMFSGEGSKVSGPYFIEMGYVLVPKKNSRGRPLFLPSATLDSNAAVEVVLYSNSVSEFACCVF